MNEDNQVKQLKELYWRLSLELMYREEEFRESYPCKLKDNYPYNNKEFYLNSLFYKTLVENKNTININTDDKKWYEVHIDYIASQIKDLKLYYLSKDK